MGPRKKGSISSDMILIIWSRVPPRKPVVELRECTGVPAGGGALLDGGVIIARVQPAQACMSQPKAIGREKSRRSFKKYRGKVGL